MYSPPVAMMVVDSSVEVTVGLSWNVGVVESQFSCSDKHGECQMMDGWMGWAGLNARMIVIHGWSLVLHSFVAGRGNMFSDSVDAASVSVSRAHDPLDELGRLVGDL